MHKQGLHIINSLRLKWIACRLIGDAILAFAIALTFCSLWFILNRFWFILLPEPWWLLCLTTIIFVVLLLIRRPWRLSKAQVAAFLNQTYPQLEESAELLLIPADQHNLLQNLQASKTENILMSLPRWPKQLLKLFKVAAISLGIALGLTLVTESVTVTRVICALPLVPPTTKAEKILPQVEQVQITVIPPGYTHKPVRKQTQFGLSVEEGSIVKWVIRTNVALKKLELVFNNREHIELKSDLKGTQWTIAKHITDPVFYQLSADGKLSDLYQVVVVKDHPPLISIKSPKQYTYIDAGEAPRVSMVANVKDDYGISNAMIHVTVAKGSGESVKFNEYNIGFGNAFSSRNANYNLKHLFELPKMNMEPGDELYFYIEALDTHQQKTRTDVYTVTLQDTAALLSMNGLINNPNIKPEYFRSQRQIIMDTELLLKQKDSISKDAFNTASNNIATDQKLLRLRYGRFLGEEDESDVGGIADNPELSKAENFNNTAMIMDALTDKHDNAEDATYFEPGTKAQLKATLTEMWNAELRLRLFKPREALAYEYKALRLLKDLQQRSRAYVAKTSYTTTPLKPEKRLTGELDKVISPTNKQAISAPADKFTTLKAAAAVLEQTKAKGIYNATERRILADARRQLALKASSEPGLYLPAVGALNRILNTSTPSLKDIKLIEVALQQALPASTASPTNTFATPDMGLSKSYYQNLKSQR